MSFDKAIRAGFENYANFKGRSSRSEYWYWLLFFWVGWYIIIAFTRLFPIWDFGLFVPTLAVGVRRMHDVNRSGWWIIFPFVNLVLATLAPVEPNRYGGAGRASESRELVSTSTSTSAACANCGTLRLEGQNFCQSCGQKFN